MQAKSLIDAGASCLFAAFAASAMIATAAPGLATEESAPRPTTAKASDTAQMVGVFTGEYVKGVPVYRFPPLTISANRKSELARPAPEDMRARTKQARAKLAADRRVEPQQALMASDLSHK